jgi:hypothetical protein
MTHEETELKHANQLDRIVENIIQGDRDLFEGVYAQELSHDTMVVVDLATFVMPLEATEAKEFGQRMRLLAIREARGLVADPGPDSKKATGLWSRFLSPVRGVGSAVAAFCTALFVEPMLVGREGRSIDTFSRPWYNVTMGKYSVVSAYTDAQRLFFSFSDAASGHRATACR